MDEIWLKTDRKCNAIYIYNAQQGIKTNNVRSHLASVTLHRRFTTIIERDEVVLVTLNTTFAVGY